MAVVNTRKCQAGRKELRLSVLTSCSDRPLYSLIREVAAISSTATFDLFVLRDADISDINNWLKEQRRPPLVPELDLGLHNAAQVLAVEQNLRPILDWICDQFRIAADVPRPEDSPNKIAALATYFPDITSHSTETRSIEGTEIQNFTSRVIAIRALQNTVRLALALKDRGLLSPAQDGRTPAIVEMVCGTVLDRCPCAECQDNWGEWAVEFEPEAKLQRLCEGLKYVVNGVYHAMDIMRERRIGKSDWALALEVEPGPAYVFNRANRVEYFFALVDSLDAEHERLGASIEKLTSHIGLNADIAHLRIAGVDLELFRDRIVHSHVCDLPGMHTRDQVVGVWDPVAHADSEYYQFLRLLSILAGMKNRRPNGLPFSGTLALELEGSNRISWIHNSIPAMRHLVRLAARIP